MHQNVEIHREEPVGTPVASKDGDGMLTGFEVFLRSGHSDGATKRTLAMRPVSSRIEFDHLMFRRAMRSAKHAKAAVRPVLGALPRRDTQPAARTIITQMTEQRRCRAA